MFLLYCCVSENFIKKQNEGRMRGRERWGKKREKEESEEIIPIENVRVAKVTSLSSIAHLANS
jgi:hypothetical protein